MKDEITDYDLQALIDNELDVSKKEKVLKHIEGNPAARKRYEELVALKNAIREWYYIINQ